MSLLLDDLISLAAAAELAGVHIVTVWRWCVAGKIPSERLAGHIVVPRGALVAFVEGRAARMSERNTLAAARRWEAHRRTPATISPT